MKTSSGALNLSCKILHLEDDDNDSWFFQRALKALAFTGIYRHVCDVPATIQYLSGLEQFSDRTQYPLPDVLVVDTTLGEHSTADLFAWLDPRPEFKPLVKLALTGGISPADHAVLLGQGVVEVLSKGVNLADFTAGVAGVLSRCSINS